MKPSRVLLVLFWLVVMTGCSVKENRKFCPCRLEVDFSVVDTSVIHSAEICMTTQDGFISYDHISSSDFFEDYVRNVPRSLLRLNVWYGSNGFTEQDNSIIIPYGSECPCVYMEFTELSTDMEACRHVVRMRKNHCVMTIYVEGEDKHPYGLRVRGNVNGYRYDGKPRVGEFACVSYPDECGVSEVVLPRQIDNSLLLDIDDGTEVIKTFALGEYIAASGYDWTSPDLQDLSLDLEYYLSHVILTVQGWDSEYTYNIIL
ncbi:MAG: hypothetical protein E7117_09455 [Bacteroidales bacterium]|nr:hypothetical protein [Bacteroidales bacterium]